MLCSLVWIATALFAYVAYNLDLGDSPYTYLFTFLFYGAVITVIIATSSIVFASDITSLWKMIESFKSNNPKKPNNIVQHSLHEVADHLYGLQVKHLEKREQMQQEQEKALKQQKEDMLSRQIIANNINHEIKTPIGIIQGYIDTLLEHGEEIPAEMRKRFLQKCLDNTKRLQNMAYNVSVITRIDNGTDIIQMDNINLVDTVRSVADDLHQMLEKAGITFTNMLPKTVMVRSNSTVLYNIFSNLTKNAVFYSEGSEITIEFIDMRHLSFRDNGKGVSEEYLGRLFDRFYRIDRDRNRNISSSGLGLSIVKQSVEMHGWKIKARNHPDGGLQFIISSPHGPLVLV